MWLFAVLHHCWQLVATGWSQDMVLKITVYMCTSWALGLPRLAGLQTCLYELSAHMLHAHACPPTAISCTAVRACTKKSHVSVIVWLEPVESLCVSSEHTGYERFCVVQH